MANIQPAEIVLRVLLGAIVTSWCWLIMHLIRGKPLLPERPIVGRRAVTWHFRTIGLVFLLYCVVSLFIVEGYRILVKLLPGDPQQIPWSHLMFLNGLAMVVLLVVVPWAVRATSGATLRDVGLSFDDWWSQAVFGVIATLIAAPAVYAVQFGAAKIWDPEQHPLSKMITEEFSFNVGWLAVVTAVILAPMFEELVFRGLLQSWLVAILNRGARPVYGPWRTSTDPQSPVDKPPPPNEWAVEPEFLAVSVSAITKEPDHVDAPNARWLAIVLTSLLFAYVHAPQWPAPIALFVLAMVIGTVYERTGSLIAAICMHATFNGISTLMLFATVLAGHKLEPDKVTSVVTHEMPTAHAACNAGRMLVTRCDCRL